MCNKSKFKLLYISWENDEREKLKTDSNETHAAGKETTLDYDRTKWCLMTSKPLKTFFPRSVNNSKCF